MKAELLYFHDPMCSWCWGFKPCWELLQTILPVEVQVQYVLGGLAEDCDEPMPAEMQRYLQDTWQRIHNQLGTKFNFAFWRKCKPRRSSYSACRAVLSAREQDKEKAMIAAIQEGYYLQAKNPSDNDVLLSFAAVIGLDTVQFQQDLCSERINLMLQQEIVHYKKLAGGSLPSLALVIEDQVYALKLDYRDPHKIMQQITALMK